ILYARIEKTVQYIGHNIHDHKESCRYQNRTHHYRIIQLFKCIHRYFSDPLPPKYILYKKSTRQELSKPSSNRSNDRVERVFQSVPPYHYFLRQTLSISCTDIVLIQYIEHSASGELRNNS